MAMLHSRLRILCPAAIVVLAGLSAPAFGAGDAVRGNELFQRYCVGCHGPDGRGGRKDGFMPRPQNLTKKGYIDELPDEYLFTVISKGGEGVNKSGYMPSFEKTFSSENIEDLIAFIRTLAPY
jgi:mono/diheme cytochrome c family protein